MIRAAFSASLCVALLLGCGGGSTPVSREPEPLEALPPVTTPDYELIPGGPLVVLLAMGAHDTLYGSSMENVPSDLIGAGFSLLSLDMPCHGPGEDPVVGLHCWRDRIEAGDINLFLRFCSGLSNVLDELAANDVSIIGQSRGGYVAITCAAYDDRFRRVALLRPVTDLARLSEFADFRLDQALFGTDQFVPYLSDRPVLVRIGRNDQRVGTDAAIAFAEAVGAELHVLDVDGHAGPDEGVTTQWLLERLP